MKKKLLIVGGLLLLGFALFSKEIKQGAMRNMDFAASVKIQEKIDNSSRLRTARLIGEVMEGSTFFASPEVSAVAIILFMLTAAAGEKNKIQKLRVLAIPLFFALLVLAEMYG